MLFPSMVHFRKLHEDLKLREIILVPGLSTCSLSLVSSLFSPSYPIILLNLNSSSRRYSYSLIIFSESNLFPKLIFDHLLKFRVYWSVWKYLYDCNPLTKSFAGRFPVNINKFCKKENVISGERIFWDAIEDCKQC